MLAVKCVPEPRSTEYAEHQHRCKCREAESVGHFVHHNKKISRDARRHGRQSAKHQFACDPVERFSFFAAFDDAVVGSRAEKKDRTYCNQ
jgi:hypothetical protein